MSRNKNIEKGRYSENPYSGTSCPLLVLHVDNQICRPRNQGFGVMHWHQELQFILILKGTVHVRAARQEAILEEGDALFLNRGVLHQVLGQERSCYRSFLFPMSMLSFYEGSPMEKEAVRPFVENTELQLLTFKKGEDSARGIQDRLWELKLLEEEKPEFYSYRVWVKVCQLWLELMDSKKIPSPSRTVKADKKNQRMQVFLEYIHSSYQEEFTLQELADTAYVSKSECIRCFREYLGCTPFAYVMNYRITQAARLLRTTQEPITEIAWKTGFRSASYFNKCFQKFMEMTPSAYRRAD